MMGPERYLIHIDYKTDFVAGSGMSVGGQLGTVATAVATVMLLLLGVLAIISKFHEWGAGEDSPLGLLGILARAAFMAVIGGILTAYIQSL